MKTVQYIFVERTAREKSEGVKQIAGKSTSTPTMKREAHNESVAKLVRTSTDNVAQTLSTAFFATKKSAKTKGVGNCY
jgi:hypothetical protein